MFRYDDEGKEIKKVIKNIFQSEKRLSRGFNQYSLEQIWRDTFGEVISGYTSNVKFYKGTLTVYITSSSLKQEIVSNQAQVIENLNKVLKYNKVERLLVR